MKLASDWQKKQEITQLYLRERVTLMSNYRYDNLKYEFAGYVEQNRSSGKKVVLSFLKTVRQRLGDNAPAERTVYDWYNNLLGIKKVRKHGKR